MAEKNSKPEVKGNTIASVLRYIKSEFGEEALGKVKADCLRFADILAVRIDRDAWYPYGGATRTAGDRR